MKYIMEDTIKQKNGKWVNKGDSGETHGEFKTKKAADAQRKAIFASGWHESLNESIDSSYEYYQSKLDRPTFDKLIRLDPTFDESKDKLGTYGKWIITNYLRTPETDVKTNQGHVKDCLARFDEVKNKLNNSDIMRFKSLADIDGYLNDNTSYKDQTHRQVVRQNQDARRDVDLNSEADLVYEDNDWEVWIPKTYAASCKLGQGSYWCTASTEGPNYYNYYTKQGPLYININKHNPDEKYQFHFESISFMNKNDHPVGLSKFFADIDKQGLYNFYNKEQGLKKKFEIWSPKETQDILKNGFVYDGTESCPKFATKASIDDSVTSIDERVFYGCKKLASINIPNSVTSISKSAFYGCTSLKSIAIPNSVTSIGDWAFAYCTSLESINIPDSVTSIGDNAFASCEKLNPIEIPNSVTSIGKDAFYGCTSLESITLPDSVTEIGEYAFSDCTSLKSITISNSVTSISEEAFRDCKSLESITIPDSVTSIGRRAFCGCESLKSITIPDSVTYIGDSSFAGCIRLESITLPDSVTSIGNWAFHNCYLLKSITIPDSVTYIGNHAFAYCDSLKSITIPDSVTSISESAFLFCNRLKSITIPDSVMSIGKDAFFDCNQLTIKCHKGSYAEKYAKKNGIPVELIEELKESSNQNNTERVEWKKIKLNGKEIGRYSLSYYDDINAVGIGSLEIYPEFRDKGYSTKVIKQIIENNKDKCDLIYCFVDADNEGAIRFYKRLGKVFDENEPNKNGQYYVELYSNSLEESNRPTSSTKSWHVNLENGNDLKIITRKHKLRSQEKMFDLTEGKVVTSNDFVCLEMIAGKDSRETNDAVNKSFRSPKNTFFKDNEVNNNNRGGLYIVKPLVNAVKELTEKGLTVVIAASDYKRFYLYYKFLQRAGLSIHLGFQPWIVSDGLQQDFYGQYDAVSFENKYLLGAWHQMCQEDGNGGLRIIIPGQNIQYDENKQIVIPYVAPSGDDKFFRQFINPQCVEKIITEDDFIEFAKKYPVKNKNYFKTISSGRSWEKDYAAYLQDLEMFKMQYAFGNEPNTEENKTEITEAAKPFNGLFNFTEPINEDADDQTLSKEEYDKEAAEFLKLYKRTLD